MVFVFQNNNSFAQGTAPCALPPTSIVNSTLLPNQGTGGGDMNSNTPTTVQGWYVSHGSPSLTSQTPPTGGATAVWMWSYSSGGEGIFTCYKFQSGQTYTICLWVKNTNAVTNGNLIVKAANGLSQSFSSLPTPTSFQLISDSFTYSPTWTQVQYTFTANQNYNQLWVYPFATFNPNGGPQYELEVDMISDSCARTTAPCNFTPSFGKSGCNPIQFTDASTGSGTSVAWFWDFGDGTFSNEQNPLHSFSAIGNYQTCLTVIRRAQDGSTCCDQYCANVQVDCKPDDLSIGKPLSPQNIDIFPNPADDKLMVTIRELRNPQISLTDINGRILVEGKSLGAGQFYLDVRSLSTGIYIVNVKSDEGVYNKKVVIK